MFIAAACADGETLVSGAEELRVKESDRIAAMSAGLTTLGWCMASCPMGCGSRAGPPGRRLAVAWSKALAITVLPCRFAIASLRAASAIKVRDVANVATSFPGFVALARSIGIADSMNSVPIMTIDGPSGSGKGTVARAAAHSLGWGLLDSGALYRLVALAGRRADIGLENGAALAELAIGLDIRFGSDSQGEEVVWLGGQEVTSDIRTEMAGNDASKVAALPLVRAALLERQRRFALSPGLVADGRDMGTVVFPDAQVKIFLTASPEERAQRRYKQLKQKGVAANLAALSREIAERDQRDSTRAISPLVASDDAVSVDTTGMSVDDVIGRVLKIAHARLARV